MEPWNEANGFTVVDKTRSQNIKCRRIIAPHISTADSKCFGQDLSLMKNYVCITPCINHMSGILRWVDQLR